MPLLIRYYTLFERDSIIKEIVNIDENSIPVRLWNIDYIIKDDCYSFYTFTGEQIIIQENKKFLWEKANGINSILEIITHENSPFELNENTQKEIIEFYKKLYYSFALVFAEY